MERDKIIFLRNFFFCAFITGVVIALFYVVATYAFWDSATQWVAQFYKVDEKEFGRIVLTFFTNVRLVLVFLFLVPALAFHWMARKK
jgi:cell division protein FtsX